MRRRRLGELGSPKPGFRHRSAPSPALGRGVRGAWTQGQQRSIARTHRIQDTGTCLGPEGGNPQGWSAGGSAGQRAQHAPRRGLHRTAASRGRIRARPRPPPALGRSSRGAARGRGWRVSQRAELQGCGAAEPRSPRPRAPGPAQREKSRLRREDPASRVPAQSVPYLGNEPRSGEESTTEGREPGRRRRHAGSALPTSSQPGQPAAT